MNPTDILTPRLRLAAVTTEMMRADAAADYTLLSTLIGAEVPPMWPPEHWEAHVFGFIEQMYAQHPHTRGWNRYVLLRAEPSILIGTLGAFPLSASEAEIGYSILPPWQRMGLATEAATALIAELWRNHTLQTITAQTFPSLAASLRVMQKCGMQFAGPGEEKGAVRYGIARRDAP